MLEAKIIEVDADGRLPGRHQLGRASAAARIGQVSPGTSSAPGRGTHLGAARRDPRDAGGIVAATAAAAIAAGTAHSPAAIAGGAVFGLALQTSNFAALLTFLETQGNVQVLSSPRIATLNNQKAVLKVGTDEFFVTNVIDHRPPPPAARRSNTPTDHGAAVLLRRRARRDAADRRERQHHPAHPSVGERGDREQRAWSTSAAASRTITPAARHEHGQRDRHHRARERRQHRRHRRADERRRARQPRRHARASPTSGLGALLRNTDRTLPQEASW